MASSSPYTLSELRAATPRRMTVMFSTPVNGDTPPLPSATLVTREPARWVLDVHGPLGEIIPRLAHLPIADVQLAALWTKRFSGSWVQTRLCAAGREMTALVVRSLGRVKFLSTSLALVLAGLQLALIAAAASFTGDGRFEQLADILPAFAKTVMGPALTSFRGMVLFFYFDPLIVMLLVQFAIYLATEPAGEVESSLVDLVLARPLPRHWIVSRSFLVMAIGTMLMGGAMMATTWAGLWWMAPPDAQWPTARTVLSLNAHMTLVAWCFGCAALAASGWARRRGAVVGAIGVVAITAYLVELLESIWAPAREPPPSRRSTTTPRPPSLPGPPTSRGTSRCSARSRWPRSRSPTGDSENAIFSGLYQVEGGYGLRGTRRSNSSNQGRKSPSLMLDSPQERGVRCGNRGCAVPGSSWPRGVARAVW